MLKQTRVLRSFLLILIFLANLLATPHAQAQQQALHLLQSVTGEINDTQTEQLWTFDAVKDQRLSLRMQATSGNLEPHLELMDSSSKVLVTGVNPSFGNGTIDAFSIPESASYTVRATRGQSDKPTTGAYTLTLLPGFSFLLLNDPISTRTPLRTWREANAVSQISDGKLRLQLSADNNYTFTTADKLGEFKDLYLQADIRPEPASGYWEGGLLLRAVRKDNALEFYMFFINSENQWKLAVGRANGLQSVQDWTALPTPLQTEGTLGMMARADKLTLFFNGQLLTELTDASIADPGLIGVAVGTGKAPNNVTSILFDNIVVTVPADQASALPLSIPPKLDQWQRAPGPIMEELQAARLIPNGGKPGLDETIAFVTASAPLTIVYQPLAKSLSFSDVVFTADITWESSNENVACGMKIRTVDDNNFTMFYLDRKGGFGIRQENNKEPVISIYNLSDAIHKDNRGTNRVTIIAIGNGLIVYINGVLATNINVKQTAGGIQVAAYNYERGSSLCQFRNIWVRSFDR